MNRLNRIAAPATFGFRLVMACAVLLGATIVVAILLGVSGVVK